MPSCSGVPVDSSGTAWSGTCTFALPGTYTFVCTVHPEEMKGAITVPAGETTPTPPPAGQPPAPAEGLAVEALQLAERQRGRVVRGSISVSSQAVGGTLGVELAAKRASLGALGKGRVRVGKLARQFSEAGLQRFAVPISASAQRALRHRRRLSVTVEIVVRPPDGPLARMTRRVELHE